MKLSAVIITFNEEKNIKRCLDSLLDITDEIIVVDSFSTDCTEEICRKYEKVRFISHAWEGFSKSKNFANSQAQNDFIFSIDADEVVSEELKQSILKIKENQLFDTYKVKRLTNYCGKWIKHCGWYPDTKLRLWNRNEGKWEGEIHEKIIFSKEVNTCVLEGDLLHYSYHTVRDHLVQVNKYSELMAQEAFKNGKKVSLFQIFIKTQWKFVQSYFFRLGILDGYEGYVVSKVAAFTTFIKYVKLRNLYIRKDL